MHIGREQGSTAAVVLAMTLAHLAGDKGVVLIHSWALGPGDTRAGGGQPVLYGAGVADLFSGDAGHHHDLRLEPAPVHLPQKHPQVSRSLGWPQLVPLVRGDHHHLQMLHLRVLLKKPTALLRQRPDSLQRREEVVQTLLMSSRGHHTCTAPTPHRRWAHIQTRSQSREPTHPKLQGYFH